MCLSLNCILMRHTLSKILHAVVKNCPYKKEYHLDGLNSIAMAPLRV